MIEFNEDKIQAAVDAAFEEKILAASGDFLTIFNQKLEEYFPKNSKNAKLLMNKILVETATEWRKREDNK